MLISNETVKLILEKLNERIKKTIEEFKVASEYNTTKSILNAILTHLNNTRLIKKIDVERVSSHDYVSDSHFNELYGSVHDSLVESRDIMQTLADTYNEQLIQSTSLASSISKLNEVTNTKVDEITEQISNKFKNISINDEQWIKIDFSKNPTTTTYDVVNNVLTLKKETTRRLTDEEILTITINNKAFDYSKMEGAVDGKLISNYLATDLYYNEKSVLFDSILTTKYVVQSIDETPNIVFNIDSTATGIEFNFVAVLTNDSSTFTVDGDDIPGARNVYIFNPTAKGIIDVLNTRKSLNKVVPIVRLIDNTTGETVRDLTYFQSMKLLDNDEFDRVIKNEEELLDEVFEFDELSGKTTQSIIQKHILVNELSIGDIEIESNTYNTEGSWTSDKIETGKDIISVELFSDFISPEGTDVVFYVKVGNHDIWHEIDPLSINQTREDNIFVPNRLVIDTDAVTQSNGDLELSDIEEKNYLFLKADITSANSRLTPLVYEVKLRVKVQK